MRYLNDDGSGSRFREGRRGRHGDGGRHGRGGRGRRGGRLFGHGDLRLLILHLISDRPRHGYELIKAIEDELHGAYSPSPGVVYPILTMLVEMGHATVSSPDGTRKLYEITAAGVSFLEENRIAVDSVTARLKEAGLSERAGAAPQIVRAFENLKLALHLRQSRGSLAQEQIRSIAAALDAAAVAIEES
jgi:DNA-binding PadR family transcriptional regulator